MPKRLIIIRHGETEHNILGICQGWLNIPLNQNGLVQAKKLAEHLKNETIDVIYSSDLKRTLQTAKPIATIKNLPLIKNKKLREFNFGMLQGKTWDDIRTNYHHIMDELDDHSIFDFKDHLGESRGEFHQRLTSFLQSIEKKHPQQTVAIITHSGVKRILLDLLGHNSYKENFRIGNTSITILEKDPSGKYQLIKFNDTSHLNS